MEEEKEELEVMELEKFSKNPSMEDPINNQWICQLLTCSRKSHIYSRFLLRNGSGKLEPARFFFAQKIPRAHNLRVIFASSMLNLCELMGLRPDLRSLKTVLYFHENQLNYPKRKEEERDFHFGWIEILSCLTATNVIFNSEYNLNSFLKEVPVCLNKVPSFGYNIPEVLDNIKKKSIVLYFPIQISEKFLRPVSTMSKLSESDPINILWNHRWEHDKNPEGFFDIIFKLLKKTHNFKIFLLGEAFEEQPEIFSKAKEVCEKEGVIGHWGYCASKEEYYQILNKCHIVISTALHEFFGVSVIEAISCGCYPLCPNRLVYPEYLEKDQLYNTDSELLKKLKNIIIYQRKEYSEKNIKMKILLKSFSWLHLKPQYSAIIKYIRKQKVD